MGVQMGEAIERCKCGADMVLRNGKFGQFWGCSTFPRCKQTKPYKANGAPAPVVAEKAFVPSHYQAAVFEFIQNGTGHGVVDAKAGSGKTRTIVEGLRFTPTDASVAFIAFNRHIANTLAQKAPAHVHVSTCHSLGLGNITNARGKVKVEPNKIRYIVKNYTERIGFEQAEALDAAIPQVVKLVSLLKATLLEPTTTNLDHIADRWNVETNGDRDLIYDATVRAFRDSLADTATVDYDDMIYLPATGRVPCQQFDYLFVDETQDLNAAQLELAVRSVKPGGRIIAVGDPFQSIYGFRGADTEAMPRIIARLNATVLPLSITYRCPKSHVALAQTLVPDIEAAEWAEDGVIEGISEYRFLDMVRAGDLVLCRTNAPLVGPAFNLIRQGRKAVILGRDIGSGLVALIRKAQKQARVRSLEDTLAALADYRRKEIAKLIKQGKELAADALDDKVETIFALSDGCYSVAEVERKIETVFSDEAEGVTFGTVHKTKGGEADRVFILKPELMPHPKATADWEMEQEWNLMYVAYTRSKRELYFIGGVPTISNPEPDGTEGQDRDNYSDDQDRENYAVDEEWEAEQAMSPREIVQGFAAPDDGPNAAWLEWKNEFARREAEQEREAFASDPDYQEHLVLAGFPAVGRFEDNIYRPSALELARALPDFEPSLDRGQLVLSKQIAEGHTVRVYTSIMVGEIAAGTGEDSIRVVREDQGRDGRKFHFKNPQDWITRSVPKDADTPGKAAAHLAEKVRKQIAQFTRPCPSCGALQVKCVAGKGREQRFWWKGTGGCRCKVEGGW